MKWFKKLTNKFMGQSPTQVSSDNQFGEAQYAIKNGRRVNKIKYQDYGSVRVVFDAETGEVLGTVPAV